MAAIVTAIVRGGHAFSGGAAARVVDDVGGGRDGALQPFGYHTVMIVHAHTSGYFGAVGPAYQWQMWRGFPRSIHRKRGGANPLPRHLASAAPASRFPFLVACLLVFAEARFVLAPSPPRLHLSPAMAPPQPIVVLDPCHGPGPQQRSSLYMSL
jgi:hypothetical protein